MPDDIHLEPLQEQAQALLQILLQGQQEIEAGRTSPAKAVFARLDDMDENDED
ncbi:MULTISPECIES: hypothetical protein [Achromobacter]|jgi:hypothetical protein|uniref:hypothetical protein n=1 Tax=Achromobacter TaxID=222 RepID=UPI000AE757E1|nr:MULTISPECIES: hypothetical protein [Achromobacter]